MEIADADVQRFIVEGFVVRELTSQGDLHSRIHTLAEQMEPIYVGSADEAPATVEWQTRGGFGSARRYGQDMVDGRYYAIQESKLQPIHTMMDYQHEGTPQHELQASVDQAFDSPEARSYLTALLGKNYVMDASPHTLQNSKPGREGQQWHKGQVGKRQFHQPRFVFGFYFPQEVTIKMGPTHVCARSQYLLANYPADFSQADDGVNYLGHAGAGGVYYDLADGVHEIPAAYGHQKFVTCPAGSILIVVCSSFLLPVSNRRLLLPVLSPPHKSRFITYFTEYWLLPAPRRSTTTFGIVDLGTPPISTATCSRSTSSVPKSRLSPGPPGCTARRNGRPISMVRCWRSTRCSRSGSPSGSGCVVPRTTMISARRSGTYHRTIHTEKRIRMSMSLLLFSDISTVCVVSQGDVL